MADSLVLQVGKALQEIVKKGGPERKVTGLVGSADPLPRIERPCNILHGGELTGSTRSLGFSPVLQRNICLALVQKQYIEEGLVLQLEHPTGLVDMEVTALPFIDKEGLRVRS